MTQNRSASSLAALTLGAVGVVYGDIGTSPLYALKQVFANGHVPLTPDNIFGVLSLVFWTLTVVVSLKYVVLILRADNHGEGGLIAHAGAGLAGGRRTGRRCAGGCCSSASSAPRSSSATASSRRRSRCSSAVEGLEVAAPGLHAYVVPITLVVLTALLHVPAPRHRARRQAVRPGHAGLVRRPRASWALVHIADNPAILRRCLAAPRAAVRCSAIRASPSSPSASVVLCVTGAEALYADMGHFGKRPIRLAWFAVAMPALVLNYFGQGAMLLARPGERRATRSTRWRRPGRSTR